MRRAFWKYEVPVSEVLELELPEDSKVVHAGAQQGKVFIWVLNTWTEDNKHMRRSFAVWETGCPVWEGAVHVGTVQINDTLVLHVMEVTKCSFVETK